MFVLISGTPCFDKWIDPVTGVCTCDEGMFGSNCEKGMISLDFMTSYINENFDSFHKLSF